MPWVETVPAEEAGGALAAVFEKFKIERGRMFTPFEAITSNGEAVRVVDELNRVLRFGASDLTRAQREMIAAYVSALNDCTF